jgi:hypothetical protein
MRALIVPVIGENSAIIAAISVTDASARVAPPDLHFLPILQLFLLNRGIFRRQLNFIPILQSPQKK